MKSIFSSIIILFFFLTTGCDREEIVTPVEDGLPPAPPENLRVYYEADGEVGIEWFYTSTNAVKFLVFRSVNDSSQFKMIEETSRNYFFDKNLHYDSVYYYKVSVVNKNNQKESDPSNIISANPVNKYNPLPLRELLVYGRNIDGVLQFELNLYPNYESDILGYEIFKSRTEIFEADSSTMLTFTNSFSFRDTNDVQILTPYFYKARVVDKGGLKSDFSSVQSDLILDEPELLFPPDDTTITEISNFSFRTISVPAYYRLEVWLFERMNGVFEINFFSEETNSIIDIEFSDYRLERYKNYTWNVYASTKKDGPYNSKGEYFNFSIVN